MRKYALGFMFSPDRQSVVLIKKNKPDWQRGHLNGVGGKVEEGELFYQTMVREFLEETGVRRDGGHWRNFCAMTGNDWRVECFVTFFEDYDLVRSTTDEEVGVYLVEDVLNCETRNPAIPNLAWLIPLALSREHVHAEINHPTQP